MARLTAPLLSFGASGAVAKALVFSSWKGIPYARTYVIPANPKSTAQQEVRGVFSTLCEMWKRMPALARAPWTAAVSGLPLTARNRHIQANVAALKDQANLDALVMSVSGGQAIPPASASFTPGSLLITIVPVAPTVPVGYTLTSMIGAVCKDGDPSPVLTVTTIAGEDESDPYSIELSGLEAVLYQCGVWCKWTRTSDSAIFYSTALRDSATPTA